jgi:hypothetical protein
MLCFSQIVNFENWEIPAFNFVQPETYNTAETDFSEVKFPFYRFLKRKFKSDAILILFRGHFPKKMSRKVNSQNHIISKSVFFKI